MKIGDFEPNEYVHMRNLFVAIEGKIFQIYMIGYGGKRWRTVHIMRYLRDGTLMIDDYSLTFDHDVLYPVEEPCLPLKT